MGDSRSKRIAISDLYGDTMVSVDDIVNALCVIDVTHREIHEGEVFMVTKAWSAVADSGTKTLQIETDSTTSVHLQPSFAGGGDAYAYFNLSPTHAAGSTIVPMNLNRASLNISTATVRVDPTGGSDGTAVQEFYFPGGTKNAAVGGEGQGRSEVIIPPSTKVLFKIKNTAGSAKDLWVQLSWYEVTS